MATIPISKSVLIQRANESNNPASNSSSLKRVLPSLAKLHHDNFNEASQKMINYLQAGKCNFEFVIISDSVTCALVKKSIFEKFTVEKSEDELIVLLIELTEKLATKILNNSYPLTPSNFDMIEKLVEYEVFNQVKKLVAAHLGRNVLAAILVNAAVGNHW